MMSLAGSTGMGGKVLMNHLRKSANIVKGARFWQHPSKMSRNLPYISSRREFGGGVALVCVPTNTSGVLIS